MKVLAAYLLAQLGGNNEPCAEDLKKILASVGIEAEKERMELLLSQVRGKDLAELIASGREKLASVGSAATAAPVAVAASAGAPVADEPTKEEKVEEEEGEEDVGIFDLFT